jgi:guanine deaminase
MDRRTLITGGSALLVSTTFVRKDGARAQKVPFEERDSEFMNFAIEEAKKGDRPFGAVIVREDKVLALGRDSTKRNSDPTAHAIMVAIRDFLAGHEPETFGIPRLVYAASIKELSKLMPQIDISAEYVAGQASFADIGITGRLLSGNALRLFE